MSSWDSYVFILPLFHCEGKTRDSSALSYFHLLRWSSLEGVSNQMGINSHIFFLFFAVCYCAFTDFGNGRKSEVADYFFFSSYCPRISPAPKDPHAVAFYTGVAKCCHHKVFLVDSK